METKLDIIQIILESGMVVKLVLLLLLSASVFSWSIILKKRNALKLLREENMGFKQFFEQTDNLELIMQESQIRPDSNLGHIYHHGYAELDKIKNTVQKPAEHFAKYGFSALERAMKKAANISNIQMNETLGVLASIGSISPFVGLFGTVWGIINSFSGLTEGGATLESVAPGIAEALVATAIGLAAAIPAVWFYNRFAQEITQINLEMESFGEEFLNLVEREVGAS